MVVDELLTAESGEERPWLSEDEFLAKYRVSRVSFAKLVDLIKNHKVFNTGAKKKTRYTGTAIDGDDGDAKIPWNRGLWWK